MACGTTGACGGSGCAKDSDGCENSPPTASPLPASPAPNICYKCKEVDVVKSTGGLCGGCFDISLFAKFRQAITTQDLISSTDNVLVAFSGGPCSRVALQFVHELQHKAQRNFDASKDKSCSVFGVGVAFIDETAVTSVPSHEFDTALQEMRLIVSSLAPPTKKLHIVPIQSIFSSDSTDGRNKLDELLHTISDATGKEDLLHHLRMMSLQKIAFENRYNKLVLGSCSSRIACHVLSATVKGQGYSLPADIQYIDARWEIPVVLPLRDCLSQELNLLCTLNRLKTLNTLDFPHSGINGLVSSFLTVLQEENPARERTIVRTAEKLLPFHFNRLPEIENVDNRRRRKKQNLKPSEPISSEIFCPICYSPINKVDLEEGMSCRTEARETSWALFGASCCPSCQFQILPKDSLSMEEFYSNLPQKMTGRAKDFNGDNQTRLREQIKDCLLSDDEDGS
ncbi:hypothetical protein ACHQM5_010755 [Ranunculus cassubicifolius]